VAATVRNKVLEAVVSLIEWVLVEATAEDEKGLPT
jgi:urease gamma subunit